MRPDLSSTQLRFLHAYDRLLRAARRSAFPNFGTRILNQAWQYQMDSERIAASTGRQPLSTDARFYVYVLMDPRKPGPYSYRFCEKTFTFPYLPFYIGKGSGSRDNSHVSIARRYPEPVPGDHKGNTIRKILRMGFEPIVVRISTSDIEAVALAKESYLIEVIGRRNVMRGPLTNMTDGGEGATGTVVSEKTRELLSAAGMGRTHTEDSKKRMRGPKSEETRLKMSEAQKGNTKGRGNRGRKQSPEHIAALSAVRRGRKQSAETIAKRAATHRGMKRPRVKCPHCKMVGPAHSMGRWHFNKCKFKV